MPEIHDVPGVVEFLAVAGVPIVAVMAEVPVVFEVPVVARMAEVSAVVAGMVGVSVVTVAAAA